MILLIMISNNLSKISVSKLVEDLIIEIISFNSVVLIGLLDYFVFHDRSLLKEDNQES